MYTCIFPENLRSVKNKIAEFFNFESSNWTASSPGIANTWPWLHKPV